MKLSPEAFGRMRLRDFFLKLHGFRKEQEMNRRERAELIRLQTIELFNIQVNRKDRIKQPSDLWKFPWDEEQNKPQKPREVVTEEQQAARLTNLLKSFKQ